jgi:hypothetical protein
VASHSFHRQDAPHVRLHCGRLFVPQVIQLQRAAIGVEPSQEQLEFFFAKQLLLPAFVGSPSAKNKRLGHYEESFCRNLLPEKILDVFGRRCGVNSSDYARVLCRTE